MSNQELADKPGKPQNKAYDLVLVMPVYNEEECIVDVVKSWRQMLAETVPSHKMVILNDGSKDHTAEALKEFDGDPQVQVINKPNAGHGPTILMGYNLAVQEGQWVFQVDSDNEMSPKYFPGLWNERENYDFLFGVRGGREQNLGRKIISIVSRRSVGLFFGSGVQDVNTPYRLMRSEKLAPFLKHILPDTFAPNVVISGLCARHHYRIFNRPVPHTGRVTGTVSIVKWKLWKSAIKAFYQTVLAARK